MLLPPPLLTGSEDTEEDEGRGQSDPRDVRDVLGKVHDRGCRSDGNGRVGEADHLQGRQRGRKGIRLLTGAMICNLRRRWTSWLLAKGKSSAWN